MAHLYYHFPIYITVILSLIPLLISSCAITNHTEQIDVFEFCEEYIPVRLSNATICVSPDYYKEDGIRRPLGYSDALALADSLNSWLPNVEMVNAIYQQADIKLTPIPMPPTNEMTTKAYYVRHNQLINQQIADSGYTSITNKLIAGHKKDVIAIDRDSPKVAIYGWHLSDSTVIQPFSTVHHREYFDYSHGIRLVKRKALNILGKVVDLPNPYK